MPTALNAIFLGNSYTNRQELIVPALLAPCGYALTARCCYGPGQALRGHVENNRGNITEEQREGIERGRIGGWFSDAHCDELYRIAASKKNYLDNALAEMPYDLALVLLSGSECANPEKFRTEESCATICALLRKNNPRMRIVLIFPWAYRDHPEFLPQHVWLAKKLALAHRCVIAPVGLSFTEASAALPQVYLHRSRSDDHQNETSAFLIAYTLICAMSDTWGTELDLPVESAGLALAGKDENAPPALDRATGSAFLEIARRTTAGINRELAKETLANLERPVITPPASKVTAGNADLKMLVIGNAYYDGYGALWEELRNSYRKRDEKTLFVETLTDDAATFQSILANNEGRLTPHQRWILGEIGKLAASMGRVTYDQDALDGMADRPVHNALEFILKRQGRLDEVLARNIPWNAIILQGFRDALEPEKHDFFAAGEQLVQKVRAAAPGCPVYLMQPWAAQNSAAEDQARINTNYQRLAEQCQVPVIPVGEAWCKNAGVNLYASKQAPNILGVQLTSETIRKALKLV